MALHRGFLAALINGIKNMLFVLEIIENNEIVNPDQFVLIAVYNFSVLQLLIKTY